jgi:hypothetical protein
VATATPSNELKRTAFLIFLISLFSYVYFFQGGRDNERARFGQLHALLDQGVPYIEKANSPTADVIVYQGHVYPNKAPGLTLIAVPFWYLESKLLRGTPLSEESVLDLTAYFVTISTVGIVTALIAVLLFLLCEALAFDRRTGVLTALGYSVGTIAFPFATLFFSHQLTAFCGVSAFTLLFALSLKSHIAAWSAQVARYRTASVVLSGLLCGYGIVCEYPAVLTAIVLSLYAFCILSRWRERFVFAFAVLCGLLPLLVYNLLVFGKPFFIAYASYTSGAVSAFREHGHGLLGVGLPSIDTLYRITFGLQRGLFLLNPWLLLSVPGSVLLWKQNRSAASVAIAVVTFFFLFNAGYGTSVVFWGGGASVGPRHLLPMLPFLALLAAAALQTQLGKLVSLPLLFLSSAIMLMATATDPLVPYEYLNPIPELFWYQYTRSNFSLWWQPVFNGVLLTENSVAFNLAKLARLPGAVQLWPLLAIVLLLISALRLHTLASVTERLISKLCWVGLALFALAPLVCAQASAPPHALKGIVCPLHYERSPEGTYAPLTCPQPLEQRNDTQLIFPSIRKTFVQSEIFAEWTGRIYFPESGGWLLGADSDDGFAIYIDGKLFISSGPRHAAKREQKPGQFDAGLHQIAVRYVNAGPDGTFVLLWAKFGQHMHSVPKRYLFSP